MKPEKPVAAPFWPTVRLLLRAARQRAAGRVKRRQQLLNQRTGKNNDALGCLATGAVFIAMAALHGYFAFGFYNFILSDSARIAVESQGRLVVSDQFIQGAFGRDAQIKDGKSIAAIAPRPDRVEVVREEADRRIRISGGTAGANVQLLNQQIKLAGRRGFISRGELEQQMPVLIATNPLVLTAGGLMLVWWFLMMALQGEGMELDMQRRRHPMWEWLLSHPIPIGAAFFAEMFSPVAANPIFLFAPIFCVGALVGFHSAAGSLIAGIVIGFPLALAASCLSKTIEIGAMLRLSPRTRGAVLGIISWLGYISMISGYFIFRDHSVVGSAIALLKPIAPWTATPLLPWALGVRADGSTSILQACLVDWALAATITAICVWISARATNRGLAGGFGGTALPVAGHKGLKAAWLPRDPLYKKELLWFGRDRGAVVQTILIPLSVGALQAYNFSHISEKAVNSWNNLCGVAIICGTYFLLILGPNSLKSEGPGLWITLTWPRGLEALLKAKARLWSVIATFVVGLIIVYAMTRFPADIWKIALVFVGWCIFARGLAEKTVTLVAAPSSSGEPEKISAGRQFAPLLGTFSFASGVFTENWHLACIGIVYSSLTAAAMWQNFRARVPYLFDPWSEKKPLPPTLMHAMIAIMCMVDGMGVIFVPLTLLLGANGMAVAQTVAYAVAGMLTWGFTNSFLVSQKVDTSQIWHWMAPNSDPANLVPPKIRGNWRSLHFLKSMFLGLAGGSLLGLGAIGYMAVLWQIPFFNQMMLEQSASLAAHPSWKIWLAIMAVGLAPFAEEYMFRGLLFRALDREWGGGKAIIGSALFFGIYHPPLSWIPVVALGIFNAWLFKRCRFLWPCVIAHMAYNTVVMLAA